MAKHISREQADANVYPVLMRLKGAMGTLHKELDSNDWRSTDIDVLLALSDRVLDVLSAAYDCGNNFYHWANENAGTPPGLTRPGLLS